MLQLCVLNCCYQRIYNKQRKYFSTHKIGIFSNMQASRDQRIVLYERTGRLAIAAARPAPRPNRPRVVSVAHCNLEGRSKLLVMAPPPRRLYTHIYGIAPYVSYVTKQLGLRVNTVAPPPAKLGSISQYAGTSRFSYSFIILQALSHGWHLIFLAGLRSHEWRF